MSIISLPSSTVKLISSSQIITSVSSVVKELIENSIDASATSIDVKLLNNGLDLIEVKDNGPGILRKDAVNMCLSSYTSKISNFDDLETLISYGFRGEALNAICNLSRVVITTRNKNDSLGMSYTFDSNGSIVDFKTSHLTEGTIVSVTKLFHNLPVRKNFVSDSKRMSDELRKVEFIIKKFSVIHPQLRMTFNHNKCNVWRKMPVTTLKQSLLQVIGHSFTSMIEELTLKHSLVNITTIIPRAKSECNVDTFLQTNAECMMIFVNKRPVRHKKLEKVMLQHISEFFGKKFPSNKYPTFLLSIKVDPETLDVNLSPNKTSILLKKEEEILVLLDNLLLSYYEKNQAVFEHENCESSGNEDKHLIEIIPSKRMKQTVVNKTQSSKDIYNSLEFENCEERFNNKNEDAGIMKDNKSISTNEENGFALSQITESFFDDINNFEGRPTQESREGKKTGTNSNSQDHQLKDCVGEISIPHANSTVESDMDCDFNLTFSSITAELNSQGAAENSAAVNGEKSLGSQNLAQSKLLENNGTNDNINTAKSIPLQIVKTNEVTVKRMEEVAINTDVAASENWSRGKIELSTGKPLQGPVVVLPNPSHNKFCLNSSMQSVSSQMGCKEKSAFTKFCRDARLQVIQENPGLDFTKAADLLVQQWNSLSKEKRDQYEDLARITNLGKKLKRKQKLNDNNVKDKRNCIGLKRFEQKQKQLSVNRPSRMEVNLVCSLQVIKENMEKERRVFKNFHLIGQLTPSSTWLYVQNENIGVFRHWGLQEVILFNQLMSDFQVPTKPLENSIPLNEIILGEENWRTMVSLNRDFDLNSCYKIISHPAITSNGFCITVSEGNENIGFLLSGVASTIPMYGIKELKEVLYLLRKQGLQSGLNILRPSSVIFHLKAEAVRMIRQSSALSTHEMAINLIKKAQNFSQENLNCLHNRSILERIFEIPAEINYFEFANTETI